MAEIASDLPSTVEETLAACPQFRIVLIGNSGVGKSSLVQSVFKIDISVGAHLSFLTMSKQVQKIDIAHDRPGHADIDHEFTSEENPRFILHDSKGFEAGSETNWKLVEEFLRGRSVRERKDQVHAIWLCIASPLEGARLLQTGEEKLLSLANELNIPVVVVFTKYDNLVKEQQMDVMQSGKKVSQARLEKNAEECFKSRTKDLATLKKVKISTKDGYLHTLQELVQVTLECLDPKGEVSQLVSHDIEDGVSLAWVTVQRVSPRQKVEFSIREGFKKYWLNLAKSSFFEGHILHDCLWRIHDDIVQIWNFNDPRNVLKGEKFFTELILLVEPLLPESAGEIQQDSWLSKLTSGGAAAAAIATPFAHILIAAGISLLALKFLYGKYKQMSLSGRYLGAYIIHLTCILQRLLDKTNSPGQPQVLSQELVMAVVEDYKETHSFMVCQVVQNMTVGPHFEQEIAKLIFQYTIPADDAFESSHEVREKRKRQCVVM